MANKLAELDNRLYVYSDYIDGYNNFTQKAWMGSHTYQPSDPGIPEMDEAAPGYSGTSGIAAEFTPDSPSDWGGYRFVNGSLAAGDTVPTADLGTTNAGLDLTGASKLVFYAKGATGSESVEFFTGGMGWQGNVPQAPFADSTPAVSLGYVHLTSDWRRYEIDLSGVDLSRIGGGFGWVTNAANNPGLPTIKFSLDDIYFEFGKPRLNPMFAQSYASAQPGTGDAVLTNVAYLYDNAVAAMALSYAGEDARARQIADAITFAVNHDRYYTDGRLRNAYSAGDPRSFPGWRSLREDGQPTDRFARLPGFWDATGKTWQEDYFAVSSSTGNLAWAVMALCEVYRNAPGHTEYLDAARTVGDFIFTLRDPLGGFTGGYEGWQGQQLKVTYKSTEHNIDLIAAYRLLAGLTGEQKYAEAAGHAEAFVRSMQDPATHGFYTGTTDDGVTISKDVLPLDTNTWAILALGGELTDGAGVMGFVEQHMRVGGGYDFDQNRDGLDAVWFEGTAQAALAYREIGDTARYQEILDFLNANQLSDGSIFAASEDGLTTGFGVPGTDLPWLYNARPHLGATAWLAFAQLARNPFATG